MGSTMGSGSRGGACRAGGGSGGGGLGSVVCDDEGRSGSGVLVEIAVEGDEMLCAAQRCVVEGRWVVGLDPRVGGRRWGDGVLEAAVAGGRRLHPYPAAVRRVPAGAAERCRFREDIRPDEAREKIETDVPGVEDGDATGGLKAEPGKALVTTAGFSELEGDSSM